MIDIMARPMMAHPGRLRVMLVPGFIKACYEVWDVWRTRESDRQVAHLRTAHHSGVTAPVPHWQLRG